MQQPKPYSPETLLEHLAWIQRLSLRLCADPVLAEDVSQETLLAAFRSPPKERVQWKPWLAAVLRNQLRMASRKSWRRSGHEEAAARPEAEPSAGELVERVGTQRAVLDAVLALPEAYRMALLRRYFDELTPSQIAEQTGVPLATVKTRLRRGLVLLREQLGAALGNERGGWMGALLPLAGMQARRLEAQGLGVPIVDRTRTGASASQSGAGGTGFALPSAAAWLLACAGALVLLVGLGRALGPWWRSGPAPAQQAGPVSLAALEPSGGAAPLETMGLQPGARVALAQDAQVPEDQPESLPDPQGIQVQATVLNIEGQPVPGVALELYGGQQVHAPIPGVTDAKGSLAFVHEGDMALIRVQSKAWLSVVDGSVMPFGDSSETTLIVASPRRVVGRVQGPGGEAIAGARLAYGSSIDLRTRFELPVARATRRYWNADSRADGSFALETVPELERATLWVEAQGFRDLELQVDAVGDLDLLLSMEPLDGSKGWIRGRVLNGAGQAAAAALVSLGGEVVGCNEHGEFQLALGQSFEGEVLHAVLPGSQPASLKRPAEGWPEEVLLQLGAAGLGLSGRIVDGLGAPREGIRVHLLDLTHFGMMEEASSGSRVPSSLEARSAGATSAVSATDGSFELEGLLPRPYRLLLEDPGTLDSLTTAPLEAGSQRWTLVFEGSPNLVAIEGYVRDDAGEAIAGAFVSLGRDLRESAGPFGTRHLQGPSAASDQAGYFRLEPAELEGARLHAFAGPGYSMFNAELAGLGEPDQVQVVLPRSGAFFVDLGSRPEQAGHFTAVDAAGEPLALLQVEGTAAFTLMRGHFSEGRSPVYRASSEAVEVWLYQGDECVARLPLKLVPGETLRVDS